MVGEGGARKREKVRGVGGGGCNGGVKEGGCAVGRRGTRRERECGGGLGEGDGGPNSGGHLAL